jgi:serine/threonine protein kinase
MIFGLDEELITKEMIATFKYRAPEVSRRPRTAYNVLKADVYSLAITLAESIVSRALSEEDLNDDAKKYGKP